MLSASARLPCKKRRPMRRADRLFQIIQVLRRTRKPLTADAIAAELETSKRTIYRDIATLIGQHVPIRGEAGMGYILEKGFDLPPLMLTPDEIEAAVLGAQWGAGHADPVLAQGTPPHRHGAEAGADPRRKEDRAALSRRTRPRQRTHHLADRHRLSRSRAAVGGMVRAAQGFSQLSHPPGRRRQLSRRKISGGRR